MKLKVLALGSGILVAVAVVAFGVNRWVNAPVSRARVGEPILAGVDIQDAARIRMVSDEHTVTLDTEDGTTWTVAEQMDYPVDTKQLKELLFKLSEDKVAHKVSENPDRLAAMGLLTAEENGGEREKNKTGTRLTVYDEGGEVLFDLLIGNDRRAQGVGYGGTYVRFPDDPAAYLISDSLITEHQPADWIDNVVLDEDADKVLKSVRIHKNGRLASEVVREEPESEWTVVGLPAAKVDETEVRSLVNAIAGLDTFKIAPGDADPAEVGRERTGRVEVAFFDGRRYTIEVGMEQADDQYRYLSIRAGLASSVQDDALREQVEAFNARYGHRLLGLYDWDGKRLLMEREDFVKSEDEDKDKDDNRQSRR